MVDWTHRDNFALEEKLRGQSLADEEVYEIPGNDLLCEWRRVHVESTAVTATHKSFVATRSTTRVP